MKKKLTMIVRPEITYTCVSCGRVFGSKRMFKNHVKEVHNLKLKFLMPLDL